MATDVMSSSVIEDLGKLGFNDKSGIELPDSNTNKQNIPEAPDNPYYSILAIPSKGYGCFAKAHIKRGTRILADSPLLSVPSPLYMRTDVEESFSKLSAEDQKLYFSLHSAHNQSPSIWPSDIHPSITGEERKRIMEQHEARINKNASLVSIFQTNCMEMNGAAAVFPHCARFNHSCTPNACFTFNRAIGKETIHAISDIAEGEEITVSYIDVAADKSVREWQLRHYGFSCDCEACTGDESDPTTFAGKSAARRSRLMELRQETEFLRGPYLNDAAQNQAFIPQMLEFAKLLREEGSYTPMLADVYLDIALVAESTSDFTTAKLCAASALKVKMDVQGLDCAEVPKYDSLLRRLKAKAKM